MKKFSDMIKAKQDKKDAAPMTLKEKIKTAFGTRSSKKGSYSAGVTLTVVAIFIVIIMLINLLPDSVKTIDITDSSLYSISDTTKELLATLEEAITIKVIASEEDTDVRIKKLLQNYKNCSDKISVEYIDPVVNPTALSTYTSDTVAVVDTATGVFSAVDFTDIIVYDLYYYYYYGEYYETEFDGEGQITAAIDRVVNGSSGVIYTTEGHGETSLPATITARLTKLNISAVSVNLLLNNGIPADCDTLVINAPESDLADDEKTMLKEFIAAGGKVVLLTAYYDSELPNFDSLLASYGMDMVSGYIADTSRYYNQNPYYIFPVLDSSSDICDVGSDQLVLVINSRGMTLTDPDDDSYTVSAFMSTSSSGLAVTEEAQTEGTYVLGAIAADDDGEGQLIVCSAASLIDSSILSSFTNIANADIFINTLVYDREEVSNIAIDAKSLEVTYNTIEDATAISSLFIVILPLSILIFGIIVCVKRKRS